MTGWPSCSTSELSSSDRQSELTLCNYSSCFATSWNHNYNAHAHRIPQQLSLPLPRLSRTQSSRLLFYRAVISATRLCGGWIRVTCSKEDPSQILGAALWQPPHHRLLEKPLDLFRSGFIRLMIPWRWGFAGYRRIVMVFERTVHRLMRSAFEANKGGKWKEVDCLYLQMIAVHERARGHGLAGRLIEDGRAKVGPEVPLLLECSEEKVRNIYGKLGFEVVGHAMIGPGEMDKQGCTKRGEPLVAEGHPIWVMIHWQGL